MSFLLKEKSQCRVIEKNKSDVGVSSHESDMLPWGYKDKNELADGLKTIRQFIFIRLNHDRFREPGQVSVLK